MTNDDSTKPCLGILVNTFIVSQILLEEIVYLKQVPFIFIVSDHGEGEENY